MLNRQDLAFIASHEGVVTKAYKCPAGIWTIGVGHTSAAGAPKVVPGMVITRDEAMNIFARDVQKYEARVEKMFGSAMPAALRGGGTSFDYNTGAVLKAGWGKKLKAGDRVGAEGTLRTTYRTGGGRVLKGLVRRRNEEADLIFHGKYPGGAIASGKVDERSAVSQTTEEIKSYQRDLKILGYYTGNIDGDVGDLTRGAVKNFQRDNNLKVDGDVGPATRATLQRRVEAHRGNTQAGGAGTVAGGGVGAGEVADGVGSGPSAPPPATPAGPETPSPDSGAGGLPDAVVDVASDVNLWLVVGVGLAVAAAVWLAWWLWRNRGKITRRRVPT